MSEITIQNPTPQIHLGFGEHVSPTTDKELIKKIQLVHYVSLVLTGVFTCATLLRDQIVKIFPSSKKALSYSKQAAALSGASAGASAIALKWKKDAYCGITNHLDIESSLGADQTSPCDVLVCGDTHASFEWKKELIRSANHQIVLSGNYCGGHSFNEILDLIEQQIKAKPELKVVILSSTVFIDRSNREKIEALEQNYSSQFQLVKCPNIWVINPSIKKSTNHSKILSIDYGTYFMMGGSGIQDKYAESDGLTPKAAQNLNPSLLDRFLPQGFRDMDFVFRDKEENGVGRKVYLESLKLALRWDQHNKIDEDEQDQTNMTHQLLSEQIKGAQQPKASTHIEKFDHNAQVTLAGQTKVFSMGPEHTERQLENELVKLFDEAENEILIDHMYFHPTEKVLEALVEAANRGIKITLITNSNSDTSAVTHKIFVPRNRYNYSQLTRRVKPELRQNIDVYEFNVPKITLHKKVIVVDDKVLSGSSNLGYKSLVTTSDHEINFITKNQDLADKITAIAKIDAQNAIKVEAPEKITLSDTVRAAQHRLLAPLIG